MHTTIIVNLLMVWDYQSCLWGFVRIYYTFGITCLENSLSFISSGCSLKGSRLIETDTADVIVLNLICFSIRCSNRCEI